MVANCEGVGRLGIILNIIIAGAGHRGKEIDRRREIERSRKRVRWKENLDVQNI